MIMMIKVIIVMMTGEHNAGDDCDEAKQKNVCVSGYQPSLSLGYQPQFFLLPFFWLFTIDSSHRKMFSVSSLFLLQLMVKLLGNNLFL